MAPQLSPYVVQLCLREPAVHSPRLHDWLVLLLAGGTIASYAEGIQDRNCVAAVRCFGVTKRSSGTARSFAHWPISTRSQRQDHWKVSGSRLVFQCLPYDTNSSCPSQKIRHQEIPTLATPTAVLLMYGSIRHSDLPPRASWKL